MTTRNEILNKFTVGEIIENKAILNGIQFSLELLDLRKQAQFLKDFIEVTSMEKELPKC